MATGLKLYVYINSNILMKIQNSAIDFSKSGWDIFNHILILLGVISALVYLFVILAIFLYRNNPKKFYFFPLVALATFVKFHLGILLLIPFILFLFVCYTPPTETYTRFSKFFKRLSIVCICSYAVVLIAYYPEANIFYPHYFLS